MRLDIKTLHQNTAVRYLFIGGTSYVLELLLLLVLSKVYNLGPVVSVGFSFWLGLLVSFALQKFLAFRNKSIHRKHLVAQALKYGLLVLINYTFTLWFVSITAIIVGLIVARTIALVITTLWNYFIYARIIFKEESNG